MSEPTPANSEAGAAIRRSWFLLGGVLLLAAALRVWRLGHGLPDFLEEAIPLRRALEMGGWQTGAPELNPDFFNYPTLVIYVHLLLVRAQIALGLLTGRLETAADFWLLAQVDPTGPVMAARLVGIVADLLTVVVVWRLASRMRPGSFSGPVAAVAVAVCAVMIRTSRLVYVDPVLALLVVAAVERLVAWQEEGGRGRIVWAVVLIGLAAGAKYQGGLLVLPLGWALWSRAGRRGLAWWPVAAAACLAVFLVTSPFVLLDFSQFWADFQFERQHMAAGHLGVRERSGLGFAVRILGRDLGPLLLLLAVAGFVAPWRRWRTARPSPDALVMLAWLPFAVSVAVARMEAERYLEPLIPLMAVAAAVVLADLHARLPARLRQYRWQPAAMVLLLVLGPAVWRGGIAGYHGRDHTQQQARRWLETHVEAPRTVLLRESYTANLRTAEDDRRVARHAAWTSTSVAARRTYLAGPRYHAALLPLLVSGEVTVTVRDRRADRDVTIPVFAHSADANAIFYEPALLQDVDYVLVSSAVGDRLRAQAARYPRQLSLYGLLAQQAEIAAVFAPGGGVTGPEVTVYHLGDRFSRAIQSHLPLSRFWWTETIPASYKRAFAEAVVPPDRRCGPQPMCPDGRVAPWVIGLQKPFRRIVWSFLDQLATAHGRAGHAAATRRIVTPLVTMDPTDRGAVELFVRASLAVGEAESAVAALQRGIRARRGAGLETASLETLLAEIPPQSP